MREKKRDRDGKKYIERGEIEEIEKKRECEKREVRHRDRERR